MDITLRAVTPADEPFLFRLYAGTRAAELALTPWNDAQREAFLRMQFAAQTQAYWGRYPDSKHQIIEADGESVGRLWVAHGAEHIHILDVALLPECSADISAQVIDDLVREAAIRRQSITIYVAAFDPVQPWFEQLGFKPIEQTGFHSLLQWQPQIQS